MTTMHGKGDDRITAKELMVTLTIIFLTCGIDSITDIALTAIGL